MSTHPDQERELLATAPSELELADEAGHEDRLELLERLYEALEGELEVDEARSAGR